MIPDSTMAGSRHWMFFGAMATLEGGVLHPFCGQWGFPAIYLPRLCQIRHFPPYNFGTPQTRDPTYGMAQLLRTPMGVRKLGHVFHGVGPPTQTKHGGRGRGPRPPTPPRMVPRWVQNRPKTAKIGPKSGKRNCGGAQKSWKKKPDKIFMGHFFLRWSPHPRGP